VIDGRRQLVEQVPLVRQPVEHAQSHAARALVASPD
jgi:hypothetical protein